MWMRPVGRISCGQGSQFPCFTHTMHARLVSLPPHSALLLTLVCAPHPAQAPLLASRQLPCGCSEVHILTHVWCTTPCAGSTARQPPASLWLLTSSGYQKLQGGTSGSSSGGGGRGSGSDAHHRPGTSHAAGRGGARARTAGGEGRGPDGVGARGVDGVDGVERARLQRLRDGAAERLPDRAAWAAGGGYGGLDESGGGDGVGGGGVDGGGGGSAGGAIARTGVAGTPLDQRRDR